MNKLVNLTTGIALFLLLGIALVSCSGGGSGTVGSSGDSGIGGGGSGTVGSSGDSGIGGGNTGTLSLGLTDGPPQRDTYEAIYVTIQEIRVNHEDKGWETLSGPDLNLPQTFNLLELVNGMIADLGAVELEAGHYNQMRLMLGTEPVGEQHDYPNYLILKGGDKQIPLKVPSGYQTGIKLVNGFDIVGEGFKEVVLDFDARKSIVKAGKSGKWILKPTIKVIESVTYSVEGYVEDNVETKLVGANVSAQVYDPEAEGPKDEVTEAARATSNENGYYFMYLPITQRVLNIVATMDGYLPECQVLDSGEGVEGIKEYFRNFALTPADETGTLKGSVRGLADVDGSAAFSIRKWDYTCDSMIEVAYSSVVNTIDGPADYYDPITLPVGTYEVVVSSKDEVTQVLSIEVAADTETVLDVFFSKTSFDCDITEREALLALYNSTDGQNWIDNTGWLGDPGTECAWYGITCQDSKVTRIDLEGNNLVGTIPPELGCISDLLDLRLHRNGLTGSIPSVIENLTNLEYLNLAANQLEGSIPEEVGSLDNLRHLYLYQNGFTGSIPAALGDLTELRDLLLGANDLDGSIPVQLGNLSNLETLNLHDNQLTGIIPEELGSLSNLQFLGLNGNQLTGSIPLTFSSLTSLDTFDVTGNCLVDFEPVLHVPNLIGADSQNDNCGI